MKKQKTYKPLIIRKNSECEICMIDFMGELKIKKRPTPSSLKNNMIIVCRKCYAKMYKEYKNESN